MNEKALQYSLLFLICCNFQRVEFYRYRTAHKSHVGMVFWVIRKGSMCKAIVLSGFCRACNRENTRFKEMLLCQNE